MMPVADNDNKRDATVTEDKDDQTTA